MALAVVQHNKANTNSNQNTVDFGGILTNTTAGTALVVGTGNAGTMTVTGVANGGDTFTQATGSPAVGTVDGFGTDFWYCLSGAGGHNNCTVTFSATSTANKEVWFWEVSGFSSATFDLAAALSNGVGVAGVDTGAPAAATGSAGFGAAVVVTQNGVTTTPNAGSPWTAGGDITSTSDASESIITSGAGTYTPTWTDSGTPRICASTMFLKEPGGGGGRTLFLSSQLDGLSTTGIKQFNPLG